MAGGEPGTLGGFQGATFPFLVCLSSPLTGLDPAVPLLPCQACLC